MQPHIRAAIERQAHTLGAGCGDAHAGGIELQLAEVVARFEEVDGDLVALCTLAGSPAHAVPLEQPGDGDDPVHWIDPDATRWWIELNAASGRVTCRAHRSLNTVSPDDSAARVQSVVDAFIRLCELWQALDVSARDAITGAALPPAWPLPTSMA